MEDLMKGMTSALAGAKPEEAQPGAKPREAQPAAKPEAAKPAKLTLTVEPSGKDLQITWEKDSAIIANANHGVLSINDGNRDQKYEMDAKQLKVGSIVYTPVGSEVSFKLEVTGKDGSKTAATPTRWSNSPASLAPEDKPAAK